MDIVEKLKLYSGLGPENYIAGSLAITAMTEAATEIERLRGALADIINPIGAMQRDLEDGYRFDGAMAVAMANDPEHYKRIARAALTANAKVSGAGTASAGLPGYAGDNNGERK